VTRTLLHSFDPPAESPVVGPTVGLEVSEIEDAGIREVLQTPGTAYGAWSILDALLTPTGTGTPFIFKEPLGQAREVKVALSGLSGRFVARAYLERYFKLSIFAHLGSRIIDLDRRRKIKVKRLSRGDLPDWIACASDLSSLTVAEAKGCHDVGGPAKALARAWTQAGRIDVTAQDRKVTVKRIAVATRWGMAAAGPADAYLSARDPVDEGDPIDPTDKDTLFIGLLRCISPTSSSHSATLNWQARSSASLISHLREGSKTTSILPGRFWMQPRSESWRKRAPWAGWSAGSSPAPAPSPALTLRPSTRRRLLASTCGQSSSGSSVIPFAQRSTPSRKPCAPASPIR
jgi:hypothetical protein